jgi:mono/diheme cytochrome c family protein
VKRPSLRQTSPRAVSLLIVALSGALAGTVATGAGAGDPAAHFIQTAAYTAEQAQRGLHLYFKNCSGCHGDMLNGAESGPALSGGAFERRWQGRTVADLYDKARLTMPPLPDQPGKLSPQEYIDIVAAILRTNGAPVGTQELAPQPDALKALTIE